MEFRKIFDTIPEQFDKFRPRYTPALFEYLIHYAKIGPEKAFWRSGRVPDRRLIQSCKPNVIITP